MKQDRIEIEKAIEVLEKMDPELAVMAIAQSSVDFEEVDKIKEFLAEHDPSAVQCAIAEVQQEVTSNEIKIIKDKLKKSNLNIEAYKIAAVELGYASKNALCMDYIGPCGTCIVVMVGRCTQDMYAIKDHRTLVSQKSVANSSLGHLRAIAEAKRLGEY
jgi:hypothetical protein